jgi:hypothetical protein
MTARRTETPAMARQICFAQGVVICPLCGKRILPTDKVIREHMHALALGGADDLENMRYVHKSCADVKTNGKGPKATTYGSDKHAIAKAARLERERMGEPKRSRRSRPIPQPTQEQRQAAYQAKKAWAQKMKAKRQESR